MIFSAVVLVQILSGHVCDSALSEARAEAVDYVDALVSPMPQIGGIARRARVFQTGLSERALAERFSKLAKTLSALPPDAQRKRIELELEALEWDPLTDAEIRVLIGGASLFFTQEFGYQNSVFVELIDTPLSSGQLLWHELSKFLGKRLLRSPHFSFASFRLQGFRYSEQILILRSLRHPIHVDSLDFIGQERLLSTAIETLNSKQSWRDKEAQYRLRLEAALTIAAVFARSKNKAAFLTKINAEVLQNSSGKPSAQVVAARLYLLKLLNTLPGASIGDAELLAALQKVLETDLLASQLVRKEVQRILQQLGQEGIDLLNDTLSAEVLKLPESDDQIEWSRFVDQTKIALTALNYVSLPFISANSLFLLPFVRYQFRERISYLIKIMEAIDPMNEEFNSLLLEIERRHPKFFVTLEASRLNRKAREKREALKVLEEGLYLGPPAELNVNLGRLSESHMEMILQLLEDPRVSQQAALWCVTKISAFERLGSEEQSLIARFLTYDNVRFIFRRNNSRVYIFDSPPATMSPSSHRIEILYKQGFDFQVLDTLVGIFYREVVAGPLPGISPLLENQSRRRAGIRGNKAFFIRNTREFLEQPEEAPAILRQVFGRASED